MTTLHPLGHTTPHWNKLYTEITLVESRLLKGKAIFWGNTFVANWIGEGNKSNRPDKSKHSMYPRELNTLVHRHWLLTMGHRHRAVVPVQWTLCVSQAGPVQHWSALGGRGGGRPRSATQGPSYTEGTGWRLGQGQCPQSQARPMAIYRQTNIWVLKVIFFDKAAMDCKFNGKLRTESVVSIVSLQDDFRWAIYEN